MPFRKPLNFSTRPGGFAGINYGHPSAFGLVGVVNAFDRFDLVSKARMAPTNTPTFSPAGVETNGSNSYVARTPAPASRAWIDAATILTVFTCRALPAASNSLAPAVSFQVAAASRGGLGVGVNSSGAFALGALTSNGEQYLSGGTVTLGSEVVVVGTKPPVSGAGTVLVALYVNGLLVNSTTTIGGNPAYSSGTWEFGIGRGNGVDVNGTVTYFNGATKLAIVWNRQLRSTEIASLSANPWQLFLPQRRRLSATAAAGGLSIPVAVHQYRRQRAA